MENSVWIDIGLWAAYILTGISLLGMVVGFVLDLVASPGSSKTTLAGLAVLAVILILSFVLADGEFAFKDIEEYEFSTTTLKLIGGGLTATYILIVIAIVSAVVSEVMNSFK